MGQVGTATEIVGSRKGGADYTTGDAHETRVYQVLFDNHDANSIDARNATGVPGDGDPLVSGSSPGFALLALAKDAQPHPNDQTLWTVTVTFRVPKGSDQLPQPNATTHKWNVIHSTTPYPVEVPVTQDLSGKLVANILGEPITPTPTRVLYDEQLNITFLTDQYDRTSIDACKGSVNGSSLIFTIGNSTVGYAAGTLQFNGWPMQEQYDQNGDLIASQTYQFLYRSDGWIEKFPNISTGVLAVGGVLGAGGTNNDYTNVDGYDGAASEPHFLNASGGIASTGTTITTSSFNFYQTASFLTLLAGLG